MNKVIILLSLVIALGSCEDSIKFEEPQPRNQNDLKRIPKQLHGLYQSRFDSTYLTINEVTIVNWTDNKLIVSQKVCLV